MLGEYLEIYTKQIFICTLYILFNFIVSDNWLMRSWCDIFTLTYRTTILRELLIYHLDRYNLCTISTVVGQHSSFFIKILALFSKWGDIDKILVGRTHATGISITNIVRKSWKKRRKISLIEEFSKKTFWIIGWKPLFTSNSFIVFTLFFSEFLWDFKN